MTAIGILSQGTIKATLLHLKAEGDPIDDTGKVAVIIKAVLKDNLTKILAEWKDASEAHMPHAWLKEMMNLQCNEYGAMAAKQYMTTA